MPPEFNGQECWRQFQSYTGPVLLQRTPRFFITLFAVSATLLAAAGTLNGEPGMTLTLTSSAFSDGGGIPEQYTCDGADISPPLDWSGMPEGTRSLALVVDDPDAPDPAAPRMTWVHWVVFNIPPDVGGLSENADETGYPAGAGVGLNDWKRAAYGGPCPPVGKHRYFHKLYALDVILSGLDSPTKADLEAAMKGHVIAEAQLVGTYQKK